MALTDNPMSLIINKDITISANISAITFQANSLILYSISEYGTVIHDTWENSASASDNLTSFIDCINKLNRLTGLSESTEIHMFFNVLSIWHVNLTQYQNLRNRYPVYVHGVTEEDTMIYVSADSTVERLFKTSSNSPIYFRDLTIGYVATEPAQMSDQGVFELDAGGPVHFEKITLQGNFNAGLISHLSNTPGQGDASTITNMRIFAYMGYGRTGSLIIDRSTKFGEIKQLQTSNMNYAIKINQTSHPFKVQALINDQGGVDIGGEGAIYALDWNRDMPAFIRLRANNSVLTCKPPNAVDTIEKIGTGNTINGVKDGID